MAIVSLRCLLPGEDQGAATALFLNANYRFQKYDTRLTSSTVVYPKEPKTYKQKYNE